MPDDDMLTAAEGIELDEVSIEGVDDDEGGGDTADLGDDDDDVDDM
jgi:hypothetical protein